MTEGSSKGLFITVAIVIFGIFVGLTYLIFEDTLSPSLAGFFESSVPKDKDKDNDEIKDVIKDDIYLGDYTEEEVLLGFIHDSTYRNELIRKDMEEASAPMDYDVYLNILPLYTSYNQERFGYSNRSVGSENESSEIAIVAYFNYLQEIDGEYGKYMKSVSAEYEDFMSEKLALATAKSIEKHAGIDTSNKSPDEINDILNSLDLETALKVMPDMRAAYVNMLTGVDTSNMTEEEVSDTLGNSALNVEVLMFLHMYGGLGRQLMADGVSIEDYKDTQVAHFQSIILSTFDMDKIMSLFDLDYIVLNMLEAEFTNNEDTIKAINSVKGDTDIIIKADERDLLNALTEDVLVKFKKEHPNVKIYADYMEWTSGYGYDVLKFNKLYTQGLIESAYDDEEIRDIINGLLDSTEELPKEIKEQLPKDFMDYLNTLKNEYL